jgi:hypothetical protein
MPPCISRQANYAQSERIRNGVAEAAPTFLTAARQTSPPHPHRCGGFFSPRQNHKSSIWCKRQLMLHRNSAYQQTACLYKKQPNNMKIITFSKQPADGTLVAMSLSQSKFQPRCLVKGEIK